MDSAVALEELSTINRPDGAPAGQPDSAGGSARQPVEGAAIVEADGLAEVGRYAARLAAFERTVLPAAEHRLGDGQGRTAEVREGGEQLTTVLHWLDRHLTGDVRATTWTGDDMSADIQAAVAHYAQLERGLIDELAQSLDDTDMKDLIRSYHEAVQVAPTRPHPKLNYDGTLGRLKFRLAGLIDDVRDGTESRPAGTEVGDEAARSLRKLDADAEAGDDRPAVDSGPEAASSDS